MDAAIADFLIRFVDNIGALRAETQRGGDLERYQARFDRITRKVVMLAECLTADDPDVAQRLHAAAASAATPPEMPEPPPSAAPAPTADGADTLPAEVARALVEVVEKAGLLRTDLKRKGDLAKYQRLVDRVDRSFSSLAERISRHDEAQARNLRTAWQLPGRSLAFRNVEHQKEQREREGDP